MTARIIIGTLRKAPLVTSVVTEDVGSVDYLSMAMQGSDALCLREVDIKALGIELHIAY